MSKKLKRIISVACVFMFLLLLGSVISGQTDTPVAAPPVPPVQTEQTPEKAPVEPVEEKVKVPAYTVSTEDEYGAGLKGHSWRLILSEAVTDEELLALTEALDNSKYEEITIWCYKSEESVKQGRYDVAMIERIGSGDPIITR